MPIHLSAATILSPIVFYPLHPFNPLTNTLTNTLTNPLTNPLTDPLTISSIHHKLQIIINYW